MKDIMKSCSMQMNMDAQLKKSQQSFGCVLILKNIAEGISFGNWKRNLKNTCFP